MTRFLPSWSGATVPGALAAGRGYVQTRVGSWVLTAALLFASTDEDELSVSVAIDYCGVLSASQGGISTPKLKKAPFPVGKEAGMKTLASVPFSSFPCGQELAPVPTSN